MSTAKTTEEDYWPMPNSHVPPVNPTGLRLIDKQIAEVMFGFTWWWNETDGSHGMRVPPGQWGNPYQIDQWYPLAHFTISWDAAGQVMEKMRELGLRPVVMPDWGRQWQGVVYRQSKFVCQTDWVDSWPLAVCLAALRTTTAQAGEQER